MINYISKPLVNEIIVNYMLEYDNENYNYDVISALRDVSAKINEASSADVQPVIHAKWVLFDKDCVGRAFYCSNCRKVTTTDDFEDTPLDREEYFCPRCGADMRNLPNSKGED